MFLARVRRHLDWRRERVAVALAGARRVGQPTRYFAHELSGRPGLMRYSVDGFNFFIRHDSQDPITFRELFVARVYEYPAGIRSVVGTAPVVADLGGNIGLYGLWAATHWPRCQLVAFEPDPDSAVRYRQFVAANRLPWTVIEACAATKDGTARFVSGDEASSHIGESGDIEVPAVDIFEWLARAEIVKIDIEGGEWAILTDSRFAGIPAVLVHLEYHPYLCPADNPAEFAAAALKRAGYAVELVHRHSADIGVLRATRI